MKRLKGIVACLIMLCLLCGLLGCSKPADSGSDWVRAYKQKGAFSDKGYYFITYGGFLRFADTASGVSVCLCSKAGCLHDEEPDNRKREDCEAWLFCSPDLTPLFFWDSNLYYVLNDQYGSHVYRRDATGANLETVATLGAKYTEEKKEITILNYAVTDGFLYYSADICGLFPAEGGGTLVTDVGCYLGRLDLQTGKEEILLERNDAIISLCAVRGDEAIFRTIDNPDTDYDDPNYSQIALEMPAALQCWDGKTGEIHTLLEKTARELESLGIVDDNKLYCSVTQDSKRTIYTYDLNTHEQETVSHDLMLNMGKGYVICRDSEKEQKYFYNLNTKKELPYALNDQFFNVRTRSDKGLVLDRTVSDGDGGNLGVFSYVKYTSLADGLQEEDLMDLYSFKVTVLN